MFIDTLIGIILAERSLRLNFFYNLGQPLSRRVLNLIKKEILDFDFNLFEATKIFLSLVDLRNNYLHKANNHLFFPSSFLLKYSGKTEDKIRIIISFFLTNEEQMMLFRQIYNYNSLISEIDLMKYVDCLKDSLLTIKDYQESYDVDRITDEKERHKRNYLFHGYYFNEINVDGECYSYEELQIRL